MPWWLVLLEAIIQVIPQILPKEGPLSCEHAKELAEHIKTFKK